jgi:hypothetical protein
LGGRRIEYFLRVNTGTRVKFVTRGGIALTGAFVMLAAAGCGGSSPAATSTLGAGSSLAAAAAQAATHPAQPSPTPDAKPRPCTAPYVRGFSCAMRERIGQVAKYLAGAPGEIGVVLRDRKTGAVWRAGHAYSQFPAASTMKLAVATDLLLRQQEGQIHFSGYDWSLMYNMLHESDDNAANALWAKYESSSFRFRIRRFGMTGASFTGAINWGFMYCTPADLDNLIDYVLTRLPARLRTYLVTELQHVAPIQRWGVWGAGAANHPGNKDGWEDDENQTLWITNTVGFSGAGQRYTLAIMYNLEGYGAAGTSQGFDYGSNRLTQVASLLFQGRYTSHPTAVATP